MKSNPVLFLLASLGEFLNEVPPVFIVMVIALALFLLSKKFFK